MSATTSSSTSTSNSANIQHPDRFYIDGQWAQPSSGKTINVLNSGTEEVFLKVAEAQEADVSKAVAAARNASTRATGRA
jgi:aldehyde dehydrogenase (NAD+)